MDLHEYLAIALTLFYTASLLHLAGGFSAVVKKESRYSVHLLSVITVFLHTIFAFWSSWSYHSIEWTAWKFFLAVIEPTLYYFITTFLIPRDAESVASWKAYFYKNKNKFYLLMLLLLLNIQVSGYFLMGLNPFKISHLPALLAVIPLVIALRSNKHMVHLSMMILFIVQVIIMMSTIAAEPGWLINR